MKSKATLLACVCMLAFSATAFTTASVPSDGVYKFTFGVDSVAEGFAVPATAVYDAKGATYYDGTENATFSYGFLGTTDTSYQDDVPASPSCAEPTAIDSFSVVQGQKIILHDATDQNGVSCVKGPLASEYLPQNASAYEGRYPIRFSMRGEERAYYAVTCTVANASTTANADVTVFSERQHIIAHHLSLAPGETKTFAWSVELAPNVYKTQGTYYDNAVNVCVVGENAALASLTVVKQQQTNGTVRGEVVDNMNVGRTMWLCTDSTGTDQKNATPYFSLQNYSGVGSGLSRWAPANLSIRNQGEGGLATNANAHRRSCLLKPGDYLYVEYGHNESSTTSFTNNLETYLADVNAAGANLIIVSPVERRSSWNSADNTWNRSLGGYAEAGEAWVEDKIANGARNVAFVDLNKTYNDWMNAEIVRIHNVNSEVSLNAAISFYYRSAKGANVDNTHINNAGTDQAAYWFWYDALARVAAGEDAEDGSAAKVQADVLKGITEGYQGKIGIGGTADNLPWSVTDDIIAAGAAPNSFWDTPVSTGYDYVKDAVVADVQATANNDGTVTIAGVTMRILNPGNYYKAVVEVFDSTGASQGKYYSYYNYDVGGTGATSGALINPNEAGFLTSDKDKAAVSAADVETVTIPAGGKAEVWMAVADAGTWQVGENAPCSPKYPVEWWSDVIFANDCSSLDGWTVNSQAVNEYRLADDGGIYFTSAGADANNTKKNYGFYHIFDDSAQMTNGRYRIVFKVKADSGHVSYQLFNSLGTTTNPFNGTGTTFLDINGTTLTAYAGTAPLFTMGEDTDGNPVNQNVVNKLRWVDVDIILDRDNDRAWISAGGSDYVEYSNSAFLPGSYSGTTWKYFGITCESQMASYGYIDDVKIVKLASVEYPTVTATAAPSDSAMGSVTINGYDTASLTIYSGNDFMIRATSADPDFYAFQNWTDGEGNVVSTGANLFIENASEDISLTANFREYARSENRVVTWDFSAYQGDFEVAASDATTITDNGMTFYLTSGDTMTADGLVWKDSAISKSSDTLSPSAHHIEFTPAASGTLTLKFYVDSYNSSRKPTMLIKAAEVASECSTANGDVTVITAAAGTEYTLSASLTAGTKYFIWTYAYNWSAAGYHHNYTIPSITYIYAPVYYTVAAEVATASVGMGTTTASASELFAGKSVTFTARPVSGAYKFVSWTDGEDNEVSTDAVYTTAVTANMALKANFAARTESEAIETVFNFEGAFGNGNEFSATGNQNVQRGNFTFYIANGDTLTDGGVHWAGVTEGNPNSSRYILWTPSVSGTARVSFIGGATAIGGNGKPVVPSLNVKNNDTGDTVGSMSADVAEQEYELEFEVAVGVTYKIYTSYYNRSTWVEITSIVIPDVVTPVTLTLAAGENGSVAINGVQGAGDYTVQKGEYVKLVATPDAYYGLGSWTDDESAELATTETFWCCVSDNMTVTANFAAESTIDITRSADFAPFASSHAITEQEAEWSQLVGRMEVHGAADDTLTENGIYWAGPGTTKSDNTVNSSGRYIKFECVRDGTLSLVYYSGSNESKNHARMYLTDGTETGIDCMYKNNTHVASVDANAANSDTTLTHAVEAGKTYYIWPYFYNKAAAKFYVTAISYTAAKSDYYTVTVNGEEQKVYHGDSIVLEAPATIETQIFTGWVDGNSESLGDGTSVLLTVTADTTATAAYRDPDAHSFVWNWNVSEGNWNDPANWYYEGKVQATTYPCDAENDYATFNTAATVTLTGDAAVKEAWFNADVTLTGGTLTTALAATYENSGKVTLVNAGFANPKNLAATISCPIVMAADTINWFNKVADGDWKEFMVVSGNISGSGRYNVNIANVRGNAIKFTGNNNDFYGDVYTSGGTANRSTITWSDNNANTYLHIGHSYRNDDKSEACMGGNPTFGGYEGAWADKWNGRTITVGSLNRYSEIYLHNCHSGYKLSLTKVGTANLRLTSNEVKDLTINGGSVTMPVGIAPQTLTIATGTKIYIPGSAEWTAGTETNLFSYATLAGTGAGTLAEQVEVTGLAEGLVAKIAVAENTVTATIEAAVPATDDENATITKNSDGSYTVEVTAETVAITVPDGVTVREVVVSPNTATVTGVPASATVKVAASWADAQETQHSAAYAIVKVNSETGAVSLDEDAVVTVGEEEIALKPQLSDSGDEVAPLDVGEEVSVGVKSIPGLVYRLARGTAVDGIDTNAANSVAEEKATSSRVSLVDDEPPAAGAFYKVTVELR